MEVAPPCSPLANGHTTVKVPTCFAVYSTWYVWTRSAYQYGSWGIVRVRHPCSSCPPPPLGQVWPHIPSVLTTQDNTYGDVTHIQLPRAIYSAAPALGYHHLADFYTPDAVPHSAQDLQIWTPRGRTVHRVRDWLHCQQAIL